MRPLTCRRGLTAVELLLVVLLLAVCAAATQALVRITAREALGTRLRTDATRDLTTLWALTSHELAHAAAPDVSSPASNALEYDRPVGEGPACGVEAAAIVLRATRAWLLRTPGPGRDR
jgi:prepilin-type N-terminal cleavage/methylation domain-containing protein